MAKGIVNVDVGGVVEGVFSGLDGLFTSKEEKLQAKQLLTETMQQPHILQAMANIEAAKHTNWFVAGGRPALLWICGAALLYNWLVKDLIVIAIVVLSGRAEEIVPLLPSIDGNEVLGLAGMLLGLGGFRMYEKTKGVAREQ